MCVCVIYCCQITPHGRMRSDEKINNRKSSLHTMTEPRNRVQVIPG